MSRIPRNVHFVFGLRKQTEPFHILHYIAIESSRRLVEPDVIYFHYHHLPFGAFWDEIRPHLTLRRVELVQEVEDAACSGMHFPDRYLYAHHADFIRLDSLIRYGGLYADIDTVFVRPPPRELFDERFVIGREMDTRDVLTGRLRPSLCNALMLSEVGSIFAATWRERMSDALNGTWSNHSGFLSHEVSRSIPDHVRVVPETYFFPVACTPEAIDGFVGDGPTRSDLSRCYSVHLWAHLWWEASRTDFSNCHAGQMTLSHLREAPSPLAQAVRPYLPNLQLDDLGI
ncbi:MAG: glycosyltransferase [Hyphomicrobiaceae bacterium]